MIKTSYLQEAQRLYNSIQTYSNNQYIFVNQSNQFADEPHLFSYAGVSKKHTHIGGSGVSLEEPQIALLKALHETCERLAVLSPALQTPSQYITHKDIQKLFPIDLYKLFADHISRVKTVLFPLKHLGSTETVYAPKELILLPFKKAKYTFLASTNGTASGFDEKRVLIKATSEVIEYDAALMWYFGLLNGVCIDINTIQNERLKEFIQEIKWYKLKLEIIEIMTDFSIPVYVAFVIDETGKGPAISCGTGIGISFMNGLQHSIEEAFQTRFYTKKLLIQSQIINQKNELNTQPKTPDSKEKRLLYWSNKLTLAFIKKKLQTVKKYLPNQAVSLDIEHLMSLCKKRNISFFTTEITHQSLPQDYHVIKALSPDLQPLYLNEQDKRFNLKRFKQISPSFKIDYINKLPPHPFP